MLARTRIPGLAALLWLGLFLSMMNAGAAAPDIWGGLEAGPHAVGFQLIEGEDASRTFAGATAPERIGEWRNRPVRVYVWYPAAAGAAAALRVYDYARMAAGDFGLLPMGTRPSLGDLPLPVPLARGLDEQQRARLLDRQTAGIQDAEPEAGPFPLILVGQGLYYESPLTHFVLCEYLAGQGYVVATCPLVGTYDRLVNLNVVDLETEVRDLEFVLARVRAFRFVDRERLGVIGYDLGGMAGLVLSMRNPDVDAFLSLDAGILTPHFSGLPGNHPDYDENHFLIPWLHVTQARFVPAERDQGAGVTLFDRKQYGDSYLLLADTDNHGDFTSYANFGIESAVPGYWGPGTREGPSILRAIAGHGRTFFDAYLKGDTKAREHLSGEASSGAASSSASAAASGAVSAGSSSSSSAIARFEHKPGRTPPPRAEALLQLMIEIGVEAARPAIADLRAAHADSVLFDEGVLNWLGYHFLYWWGREADAVAVFELNAEIHPESANAHDSLGEAYAATGEREKAIASYRRSLELNPDNANAVRVLRTLEAGH